MNGGQRQHVHMEHDAQGDARGVMVTVVADAGDAIKSPAVSFTERSGFGQLLVRAGAARGNTREARLHYM